MFLDSFWLWASPRPSRAAVRRAPRASTPLTRRNSTAGTLQYKVLDKRNPLCDPVSAAEVSTFDHGASHMFKRLAAIVFIFACTSVAWAILGSTLFYRTYALDDQLKGRVASNWGTAQEQGPPVANYHTGSV